MSDGGYFAGLQQGFTTAFYNALHTFLVNYPIQGFFIFFYLSVLFFLFFLCPTSRLEAPSHPQHTRKV
jgi:hypothetical protein